MIVDIVSRDPTVLLKQFVGLLVDCSEIFLVPRNILVVANLFSEFLWQATFGSHGFSLDFRDRMAGRRRLGQRDFCSHFRLWLILLTVMMNENGSWGRRVKGGLMGEKKITFFSNAKHMFSTLPGIFNNLPSPQNENLRKMQSKNELSIKLRI